MNKNFGPKIAAAAKEFGVSPALVSAVAAKESSGRHLRENGTVLTPDHEKYRGKPITSTTPVGVMQIQQKTAAAHGIRNVHSVDDNIRAGAAELSRLSKHYRGDNEKALAAYNAGQGTVARAIEASNSSGKDWVSHMPKETREYIQKIRASGQQL